MMSPSGRILCFNLAFLFFATFGCCAPLPIDKYFSAKCSDGAQDLSSPPATRWKAAQADAALAAAMRNWNQVAPKDGHTRLSFVNTMMNLWGQNDQNCGLVADSCDFSSLQCGDQTMKGSGHVPTPGAWLIMKSLSNIHSFYLNLYDSFQDASNNLGNGMGKYLATFAPQKEESPFEKGIEGLVEGTFGFISSFAMGPLSAGLGPLAEVVISGMNAAIKNGMDQGIIPETTRADKQMKLQDVLKSVLDTHQLILKNYTETLESGKVTSLTKFRETISDGKWIDGRLGKQNKYDLTAGATAAFAAILMPSAWRLTTFPVILMDNKNCEGTPGSPFQEMSGEVAQSSGSCIGGKSFYLVSYLNQFCKFQTGTYGGSVGGDTPCMANVFNKLPGFDNLGEYHLSKEDIITSVYNAYQNSGGNNNWKIDPAGTITDGNQSKGQYPFQAGAKTPGLYNIPICEIGEAIGNYHKLNKKLCDYGSTVPA